MEDAAGPGCKNLKRAILLNEDLLKAYKDAGDDADWSYSRVKSITMNYPKVKKLITSELVLEWLGDAEMFDIVNMVEDTAGGRYWLDQQIESFKHDLWD